MKFFGPITAFGLAALVAGAAQAAEIKIAMNSADDPAISGEASFAHGFDGVVVAGGSRGLL